MLAGDVMATAGDLPGSLHYYSNRHDAPPRVPEPGVYGLSECVPRYALAQGHRAVAPIAARLRVACASTTADMMADRTSRAIRNCPNAYRWIGACAIGDPDRANGYGTRTTRR